MKKIKLTQGKYALVDDADFDWLNQWKWFYSISKKGYVGYAGRNVKSKTGKRETLRMHRFIIGAKKGTEVDHINRNSLDNRRVNLRSVSHGVNLHNSGLNKNNTSGYRGVSWSKLRQKWEVQIDVDSKHLRLGFFNNKKEAALVYRNAAFQHYEK